MAKKQSQQSSHLSQNDKNRIRLLTPALRKELKRPQGLLIEGPFEETTKRLKELIEEEKPSLIISVGDIVSRNMIEYGVSANVLIVDNKVMRKPIQPITVDADQTLYAKNPPGAITDEAWAAIRNAVEQKGQTRVMIEGEEDLLTLAVVLAAPNGAMVVYGQPHVGIVVVKVTEETKERMRVIVDAMEDSSKS
ncbi:MAG TPA: DUF359 domain-containing protein [Candidatus Bathyarchaeota archaeon]|nr:DUF359 domain-containing protein [Candidatus Bathyarchaeota archaeon]